MKENTREQRMITRRMLKCQFSPTWAMPGPIHRDCDGQDGRERVTVGGSRVLTGHSVIIVIP